MWIWKWSSCLKTGFMIVTCLKTEIEKIKSKRFRKKNKTERKRAAEDSVKIHAIRVKAWDAGGQKATFMFSLHGKPLPTSDSDQSEHRPGPDRSCDCLRSLFYNSRPLICCCERRKSFTWWLCCWATAVKHDGCCMWTHSRHTHVLPLCSKNSQCAMAHQFFMKYK